MMIDSGTSINLIDEITFNDHRDKILEQTKNRIYRYGSAMPLPLLRTITANIEAQTTSTKAQLHVVKDNTGNLRTKLQDSPAAWFTQDLCQHSYHRKQEQPRIATRRIEVPIWRDRESESENDPLALRS